MITRLRLFLLSFILLLPLAVPMFGQSLTITKDFAKVQMASVLAMYKNEFGDKEKPDMIDTFPYAVIRMYLEGSSRSVREAKELLTLYMGQQMRVEERVTTYSNQILFLVRAPRHPMIYIDCGDGCERVLLSNMQQLESNCVYDCTVQFIPEEEHTAPTTTQAPNRQFFKIHVKPEDAIVEVMVNGEAKLWTTEDGVASDALDFGTYSYTVSAPEYYTKEGKFTLSSSSNEISVELLPKFGYLSIRGDKSSNGAQVYATNTATRITQRLGEVPLHNVKLSSGTYTLKLHKDKYKDYSTSVTISDAETKVVSYPLESNFAVVTLQAEDHVTIYSDGLELGKGTWTGELECGKHAIEARAISHQSAYTTLDITPSDNEKTFVLNKPLPITGSLMIKGSPGGAVIYVDNKKVEGTTPTIVHQLLTGNRNVRVEKEGYKTYRTNVTIQENKEELLTYTLQQNTVQPTVNRPTVSQSTTPTFAKEVKNAGVKNQTPQAASIKKPTKNIIAMAELGYSVAPQLSYGLMLGIMHKGIGWYAKGRTNFQFRSNVTNSIASNTVGSNGELLECLSESTSAWLFDVGVMLDLLQKKHKRFMNSHLSVFAGIGYGARTRYLQTKDSQWNIYTPNTYEEYSLEAGLMGSIRGFTLMAGVNTIGFKYMELEVGIGWTF